MIEQEVMEDSLNQEVTGALETLSERERIVLEMYFGINRDSAMTLNEIGEENDSSSFLSHSFSPSQSVVLSVIKRTKGRDNQDLSLIHI